MNKFIAVFFSMLLSSSCSNYLVDDEEGEVSNESSVTGKDIPMTLKVRSSSQETMNYPIQVYLFNDAGKMIKHCEVTSTASNLDLKLPANKYELTAFAGLNNNLYKLPQDLSLTSFIETEKYKPCPTPIQNGRCSFNLEKKTDLSIHLSYIVSSIEFKFKEIPSDATSVEVGISPTSYAYSLGGMYSNDNFSCKISCQQINDEWVAGPIYILPSNNSKTTLTLSISRPSGDETLSYTYSSQLEPAQPYTFSGKYKDGINLGGNFEIDGWKPGIDVDVDFSEEGQEENQPSNPENPNPEENIPDDDPNNPSSTIMCNSLPQAGDFWNDFYIWKSVPISSEETIAILLSKQQWFDILAIHGLALLEEYKDMQLTDWRVFTKEEAKEFNLQFTNTLPNLNNLLRKHNQDEFYFNNKERYLCDNCKSAFNLQGNSSIRAAGTKQTYYMRAIKNIKFKLRK